MTLMAAETSFSKGTCQWIVLLRDEEARGEETSGEGGGRGRAVLPGILI